MSGLLKVDLELKDTGNPMDSFSFVGEVISFTSGTLGSSVRKLQYSEAKKSLEIYFVHPSNPFIAEDAKTLRSWIEEKGITLSSSVSLT